MKASAAALIVIDPQDYFLNVDSALHVPRPHILLSRIQKLVDQSARSKRPVIITQHHEPLSLFKLNPMKKWWGRSMTAKDPHSRISLNCLGSEVLIKKQSYDAFYQTDLESRLKKLKVKKLIVCGVMTHLCVESTVRSAFVRGFEVVVVSDAVASRKLAHHKASLQNMAHGFARLERTSCITL